MAGRSGSGGDVAGAAEKSWLPRASRNRLPLQAAKREDYRLVRT